MLKPLFRQIVRSLTASGKIASRNHAGIRARAGRSSLTFESLETRKLLATYTLESGVLTIGGDDRSDDVVLFQNLNGDTFDVEEFGGIVATYNNADVSEIIFRGRGGDDEFVNNTFIDSTFFGHGGNDTFFGGTGNDTAFGGGDDDMLFGGFGDDTLRGGDGNDTIYGELGDDIVFAGNGDDEVFGGIGDDFLSAEAGDDILHGDEGNDFLRGFQGDDTINGGAGNDLVFGQAGDDIITGNDGNDRLRGNNDNDIIYGNDGNDVLIGDVGDDQFFGGNGDDTSFGFTGNDLHDGGAGNDRLFDSDGNDELYGGSGNDVLRSGAGNDFLKGGDGDDVLRSDAGRDRLYGGEGLDRLDGGSGDDSLHGGAGTEIDLVEGGQGADRFHQDDNDDISDRVAEDVTIQYETEFVQWFDEEIELLDNGFQDLYFFTGSQLLLQSTHAATDNVTIVKFQDLPGTTTSRNVINPETGKREIQIIDFDESTVIGREFFRNDIVHQIGNNWNSAVEISSAFANAAAKWNGFLALSSWTRVEPQGPGFLESGDGQWWYAESTEFANVNGSINPFEDFASSWSAIFAGNVPSELAPKTNYITTLLRS